MYTNDITYLFYFFIRSKFIKFQSIKNFSRKPTPQRPSKRVRRQKIRKRVIYVSLTDLPRMIQLTNRSTIKCLDSHILRQVSVKRNLKKKTNIAFRGSYSSVGKNRFALLFNMKERREGHKEVGIPPFDPN